MEKEKKDIRVTILFNRRRDLFEFIESTMKSSEFPFAAYGISIISDGKSQQLSIEHMASEDIANRYMDLAKSCGAIETFMDMSRELGSGSTDSPRRTIEFEFSKKSDAADFSRIMGLRHMDYLEVIDDPHRHYVVKVKNLQSLYDADIVVALARANKMKNYEVY